MVANLRQITIMVWRLQAALLAGAICALAQPAPAPKLPDTYAAGELRAWLRAFNSGDHKTISDFRLTHYEKADATSAELDADVAMRAYQRGGAWDLRAIVHSAENAIVVVVQSRRNGWWATVRVETSPDYPHKITFLRSITSPRNPAPEMAVRSVR
jgi:hypothetical protein